MTVSTLNNRVSYAGNGTTMEFSFPNRFLADSDLVVLEVNDTTGVETPKTLTTHYTVTGAGDAAGGTITMLVAPATGVTLVIYRDPTLTQPIDLVNGDPLDVDAGIERGFDRSTLQIQRVRDLIDRTMRLPEGDTGFTAADMELPAKVDRASLLLGFDADGKPIASAGTGGTTTSAFMATVVDDLTAAAALSTLGFSSFAQTLRDDDTSNDMLTTLTATRSEASAVAVPVLNKLREVVSVKDFGAVGDGVTDDKAAIQAALDSLGTDGGVVMVPNGMRCVVDTTLNIPRNCALVGSGVSLGSFGPSVMTNWAPAIYLNSAAKITMQDAARLQKLLIMRKGINFSITSAEVATEFVGTAIELADSCTDQVVEDCAVFGFAVGVRTIAGSTNVARIRLRRLNLDNITSVYLENSLDVCYLEELHCLPFVTVSSVAETDDAQFKRSGTGIHITGSHDWTKLTNCFTYGYATGIRITGADNVTMLSCGADYPATAAVHSSYGIFIDGSVEECTLIGCQVAAHNSGVYVKTSGGQQRIIISGCTIFRTDSNAIVNDGGVGAPNLLITGCILRNIGPVGTGVATVSGPGETRISNTAIIGYVTGISQDANTNRLFFDGVDFSGTTTAVANPFAASIASAATLALDGESTVYTVTGTTGITAITPIAAYANKLVTLIFSGILTVTDGGNLKLAGNFTTSADDVLQLVSDGTNWFEVGRSAN